jgi:hypothetical protein
VAAEPADLVEIVEARRRMPAEIEGGKIEFPAKPLRKAGYSPVWVPNGITRVPFFAKPWHCGYAVRFSIKLSD